MLTENRNIADLEKENEKLRREIEKLKSEKRSTGNLKIYSDILYKTSDSLIITGPDLKIEFWNKGSEKLFGWKMEEVLGRQVEEVTETEYLNSNREDVRKILNESGTWEGDVRDKNKSGEYRYTHVWAIKLVDEYGNLSGYATINRDITQKKLLEKELERSHERLTLLSEHAQDVFALHKPDGIYKWVSDSAKSIFGYDPSELVDHSPYDFIHEEDVDRTLEEVHLPHIDDKYSKGRRDYRSTLRFRRKDGEYIQIEAITVPILNEKGEVHLILSTARDITDRILNEEALSESRKQLKTITDALPFCVAYVDRSFRYQFNNKQYEQWFGVSAEELEGELVSKLFAYEAASSLERKFQSVFDGKEIEFEGKIKNVEGLYRDVFTRFIPDIDESGNVQGFFAVIEDITDRKKTEKELNDLAKFPGENRDPILRVSSRGEILYKNEPAERMLKTWEGYEHGFFSKEIIENIRASLERSERRDMEVRFDGQSYSLIISPVPEQKYVNFYTVNITRQKRAETALMNRIEYERLLVEITSKLINLRSSDIDDGINYALREVGKFVDADHVFLFKVDFESGIAEQSHGWNADSNAVEINKASLPVSRMGPWFFKKLHEAFIFNLRKPDDLPANAIQEKKVLKKAGIMSICIVPLVKDEKVIGFAGFDSYEIRPDWSNTTINLLKVTGEVFINALQNQQYEQALKGAQSNLEQEVQVRTAELQRSNKDLEKFAYLASHDLQEPLRMIISYLQILEKRIKNDLKEDELEFLNFSVDGAKRMKSLLDAILQYSRINRFSNPFDRIDITRSIDSAVQNLKIAIEQKRAIVVYQDMPTIMADNVQMVQLFQNLIGNALKFVEGKQPVVEVEFKELEGGLYQFEVRDNGIGIESKYKDRIFDIFQRLHTKSEYEGSGIGLAICKTIVDRHGGDIWCESEPGEGTSFFFTLKKNPVVKG